MIGRDLLNKNTGWLVGDGKSIDLWAAPCISVSEQERLIGPATEESSQLNVSSLMMQGTNEWDVERLRAVCPVLKSTL